MSKNLGGRPPAKIITENFTEIEKLDNKSNRKFWKCNYCSDDSPAGQRIEGRDNRCLLHLTDPKSCPDAPPKVRQDARLALMQKGIHQEVPLFGDAATALSINDSAGTSDADVSEPASVASSLVVVKKRKLGRVSLDGYVDHALTPSQQEIANIKLFR